MRKFLDKLMKKKQEEPIEVLPNVKYEEFSGQVAALYTLLANIFGSDKIISGCHKQCCICNHCRCCILHSVFVLFFL